MFTWNASPEVALIFSVKLSTVICTDFAHKLAKWLSARIPKKACGVS